MSTWLLLLFIVSSCETPNTPKDLPTPVGPTITGIEPSVIRDNGACSKNKAFYIKGEHLTGTHTVMLGTFKAVAGTDFDVTDDKTITFHCLPVGATSGVVTVTNPVGTANTSGITPAVSLNVLGPGPTVMEFPPAPLDTTQVGSLLKIKGANLIGRDPSILTVVYLTAAKMYDPSGHITDTTHIVVPVSNITSRTDNELTIRVPPGAISGRIWISNGTGSSTQRDSTLGILLVVPRIDQITPCGNANDTTALEIRGYNFDNLEQLRNPLPLPTTPTLTLGRFKRTVPLNLHVVTDRLIRAVVPTSSDLTSGINTGAIRVKTRSGSHTYTATNYVVANTPAAHDSSVCGTGAVTLKASGAPAGNYQWYTQSGAISGANGPTFVAQLPSGQSLPYSKTYYVSVIPCTAGESPRKQVTATWNAIPTAPMASGQPRCGAGDVTLTASGTPAGGTYRWYATNTSTAVLSSTSTLLHTFSSNARDSADFWVSAISPEGCEGPRKQVWAKIRFQPSANFNYASAQYCRTGADPSPIITGTSGGTYSVTPAVGLSIGPMSGVIDLSASTAGTYTVTRSFGSPCPDSHSVTVAIVQEPTANFSYPSGTHCANSSGTLSPTLASGATSGTFSAPTGLTITTAGVIDLATSSAGTYTVTNSVAAANGCAAVSATARLTVTAKPNLTINSNTGSLSICAGDQITLTVSGATTYLWSTTSSSNSITVAPATTTSYSVTGTTSGCSSGASVTVAVAARPSATFSYASAVCVGSGGSLSVSLGTGATAGTFTLVSTQVGITVAPTTGAVTVSSAVPAGTYQIQNAVTSGACSVTSTASVTVNPIPDFACNTGVLSVTASTVGTNASYQWQQKQLNGTFTDVAAASGGTATPYTPAATGTYRLKVSYGSGSNACSVISIHEQLVTVAGTTRTCQ